MLVKTVSPPQITCDDLEEKWAISDSRHRFWLRRGPQDYKKYTPNDQPKRLLFVMLNPSTADASIDDPTIRRCRQLAFDNGYGVFGVVNLFSFRATSPDDLIAAEYPNDEKSDDAIISALAWADEVCFAFGVERKGLKGRDTWKERVAWVADQTMKAGMTPKALGTTKDGWPRHPLYLKSDSKLQPWLPR